MKLSIVLALVFLTNVANTADSDGKEFVFSFINDDIVATVYLTTAAIIIPSFNDSTCTFQYTQQSDNKVVSIQKTAAYGKTNEISLDFKEILLTTQYVGTGFYDGYVPDFRVFASCTEEVKLIGRINDPVSGWGDHFLIPSTKHAGYKYNFALPSNYLVPKGSITLLPFTQESISVNIILYVNGLLFSNKTIQYDTTIGQNQHYIGISPTGNVDDNSNSSVVISSTSPIMLSYATSCSTTSNLNDNSCGSTCVEDYVTFMPLPVISKQCNVLLKSPDQRMMTNDFTTRLYVSPPNVEPKCNEIFTMNVYDQNDPVNGDEEVITVSKPNTISLTNKWEIGSSTNSGEMLIFRFGSIHIQPDNITAYGHFMHYVPSISEWVTGKTQFYTLAKDCYLEFYADHDGSNVELIKIDGITIDKYTFTQNKMNYFGATYGHFTIPFAGYGLHTFENVGYYVLYVMCTKVDNSYSATGYLTGFNQRKNK